MHEMVDSHDITISDTPDETSRQERRFELGSCTMRLGWISASLSVLLLLIYGLQNLCDWLAQQRLSFPHKPPFVEIGLLCSGILASIFVASAIFLIGRRVHVFLIFLPFVEWLVVSKVTFGVGMVGSATFLVCFFSLFYIGSLLAGAIHRGIGKEDSSTSMAECIKCSLDLFAFRVLACGWIVLACYFWRMPQMESYADYDYHGPMYLSRITGGKEDFPHYVTTAEQVSTNGTADHGQFLEVSWGSYWGCPEHPHTQCSVSFDYEPIGTSKFTSYSSSIFQQFLKHYNSTTSRGGEVPKTAVEIPGEMMWPQPQQNLDIWIQGNCETCTIPSIGSEEATSILSAALFAIIFGALLRAIVEMGYRRFNRNGNQNGCSTIEFELLPTDEIWADNSAQSERRLSADSESEDVSMSLI